MLSRTHKDTQSIHVSTDILPNTMLLDHDRPTKVTDTKLPTTHNILKDTVTNLKIGCLNIRSLSKKLPQLSMFVKKHNFDVFGINETWVDASFNDKDLQINGYDILRKDRNRKGGGVCIYVKSDLKYKVLTDINCNTESIWLLLDCKQEH